MHFGGNPFEHFASMSGGIPGEMPCRGKAPDTMEYYNLLNISRDATDKEIKKAFRKKAMKEHPDRGGDAEKFKKISEAYEVLIDNEKREMYNRYGKQGVEQAEQGRGNSHSAEDIFGSIFGNHRPSGPKKAEAIIKPLEVSLADIYNGNTFKKTIKRQIFNIQSGKPLKCQHCNGAGKIRKMRQIGPGMIQQVEVPCEHCHGHGYNVDINTEVKELKVVVDKGMKQNQKIKFKGKGNHIPEGEPGDVIYVLQVKEHPVFERKGPHLFIKKTIMLKDALCGVEFIIEHLDGRMIVIKTADKEIIKPNTIKIVKGEGMPIRDNPYQKGNLIIQFNIEFPESGTFNDTHMRMIDKIIPGSYNISGPNDAEKYIMSDFNKEETREDYMDNQEAYDSDEENDGFARQGVQCAQS